VLLSEPLTYEHAQFGEIKASLVLKGLPPYTQMEGGCHNDLGIVGNARPIIKETPCCAESENFKYPSCYWD